MELLDDQQVLMSMAVTFDAAAQGAAVQTDAPAISLFEIQNVDGHVQPSPIFFSDETNTIPQNA